MLKRTTAGLIVAGLVAGAVIAGPVEDAYAAFFTYAEWDALPADQRVMYIAGAYDQLTEIGLGDGDTIIINSTPSKHYAECVYLSKMSNAQLAENVRTFASTQPEMQTESVPLVLITHLRRACGPPLAN
jgi:hypothetical protein